MMLLFVTEQNIVLRIHLLMPIVSSITSKGLRDICLKMSNKYCKNK